MYVLLAFLEVNGIRIDPSVDDVARVGLAVASGESVRDTNDFLIDKFYEHMVIKGGYKVIFYFISAFKTSARE